MAASPRPAAPLPTARTATQPRLSTRPRSLAALARPLSAATGRTRPGVVTHAGAVRDSGTSPPTKAARLLAQGRAKYDAGDRMGGLRFFEEALGADPTPAERAAALFNATAVHASFGDVELAQITLREGVAGPAGLDWEAAVASGGGGDFVEPKWSPQVSIQLRKFAAAVKKAAAGEGGRSVGGGRPISSAPPPSSASASTPPSDLGASLQTDLVGLDGSVGGVVRRVAGLLVALLGLGAALFLLGKGYLDAPPLPPGYGGD